MPIDTLKVQAVHEEVRGCFKGQPKSATKGYHPLPPAVPTQPDAKKTVGFKPAHWKIVPGPAQRAQRNLHVQFTDKHLGALRGGRYSPDIALRGFQVLDQPMLIGNCQEMSEAAAYLVVLRKAGTAWLVTVEAPGDHVFCLVTDERKPRSASVNEFAIDFSGAWIIDPWANVCCEIKDYPAEFVKQMESWKKQGKFIYNCSEEKLDPASQKYLGDFMSSDLDYEQVESVLPPGLPRAVREHKDGKAKPVWSAPGKTPAAGDW